MFGEEAAFGAGHFHPRAGCDEIGAVGRVDAKLDAGGDRVLIRRKKAELPIVFLGLMRDTLFDVRGRKVGGRVLVAVRQNREDDAVGTLLLAHRGELLAEPVDGEAHGVIERRTATRIVRLEQGGRTAVDIGAVDEMRDLIVELPDVQERLIFRTLERSEEVLKRIDRLAANVVHRTGGVKDESDMKVGLDFGIHFTDSFLFGCVNDNTKSTEIFSQW